MRFIKTIITILLFCLPAVCSIADNSLSHIQTIDSLRMSLDSVHNENRHGETYTIAKQIIDIKDSIYKAHLDTMLNHTSIQMGLDKIAAENEAANAQVQLWIYISIALSLFVIISVIGLNHIRNKKRREILNNQNILLESEVKRQTDIINEANKNLTDSISYAQHIQAAIIPPISQLNCCGVNGAFAYYLPLNIVSGDFYWTENRNDEMIVACADCSGHGVPGAFMSLIGSTLLKDICSEFEDWDPSLVLTELDNRLLDILSQNNNSNIHDGMDIALMTYSSANQSVRMASARRPFYLFQDNKLKEFKGTKRSIGDQDEFSNKFCFETTEINVNPGDTIYMCSDGLADQFGGQTLNGERGRKLMNTGVRELLCNLNNIEINKQKEYLIHQFNEWKGTCQQVDDVSIVGIRF